MNARESEMQAELADVSGNGKEVSGPMVVNDELWPDRRYAWYVLSILLLAYIFSFIDRIIFGVLIIPIQADLGLSDSQMGTLHGLAFAIAYAFCGLPIGYLADRYRRRSIAACGIALWSLATAACGLAGSYGALFAGRAGVGVGESALNPTATSMIADYFPPQSRARAYGIFAAGASIGTVVAYLLGGFLFGMFTKAGDMVLPFIGTVKPWQVTFVSVGVPGLVISLLVFLTVREPDRKGLLTTRVDPGEKRALLIRFLRGNWGLYVALYIGVAFAAISGYSLISWLPTFMFRIHEWSTSQTSVVFGLTGGICGLITAILSGPLIEKLRRMGRIDAPLIICAIGGTGCAIFGGIAPLMPSPELSMVAFTLAQISVTLPLAGAFSCLVQVTPNEARATIMAGYYLVVGLLAAGGGPAMVGIITDKVMGGPSGIGYSMATVTGFFGVVGATILFATMPRFRRAAADAAGWEAAG